MRSAQNRPAIAAIALAVVVVMITACGSPQRSISTSPSASSAAAPSASVPPSTRSESPTVGPDGPLVDATVVTVSADLRVRSQPRVSDDSVKYEPVLPLGTKLHVLAGPVLDSGFVWYKVQPVSFDALDGPGFGWVAIADHDGTPWVEIAKVEPTPSPASKGFAWGKPAPASIPDDALYVEGPRLAHNSQGYALLTSPGADLWFSTDARRWRLGNAHGTPGADTEIVDVGAGDLGFVAVGREYLAESDEDFAVALTSRDGRHWQKAADPSFAGADMDLVGVGRQAIVAFQSNGLPRIWASPDGVTWDQVTTQSGMEVARGVREVVAADGRLTAFVSVPGRADGESLRVDVWQTDNGADWSKVAELPKSKGADVDSAVYNAGRWFAWGWAGDHPVAWTSTDGITWGRATVPGGNESSGPTDVIVYPGGYVAVLAGGGPTYDTCGTDESGPFATITWTSPDGRSWHKQRSPRGVGIRAMVVVDGAIVGVGETFNKQIPRLVNVTTKLPNSLAGASSPALAAANGSAEDPEAVAAFRSSTGRIAACGP